MSRYCRIKCCVSRILTAGLVLFITPVLANTTQSLPWESPLQKITQSISGPVAMSLGVIVIVMTGLGIAFGESGTGVRRLLQVVFGLAIAFTAASIIASLYQG